jgi:hypothetical protein
MEGKPLLLSRLWLGRLQLQLQLQLLLLLQHRRLLLPYNPTVGISGGERSRELYG